MSYADLQAIHDPATGSKPPAAWGDQVRDNFEWLVDPPRARVYRSSGQTIPTGTATALLFNAERYDVGGCHSTTSNTSRLTVPTGGAGLYTMGGSVRFAGGAGTGTTRQLYVRLNGSTILGIMTVPGIASGADFLSVATEYELVDGDYIELIAVQSSGGDMNVQNADAYSPEFWFRWAARTA